MLTGLLRVRSGILNHLGLSLSCAAVVDGLCVGVDIIRTLADGRHGLHDAVLGAQNGCGGVRVNALCFLAAEDLQTGGAKQNASREQTKMFHIMYLLFWIAAALNVRYG